MGMVSYPLTIRQLKEAMSARTSSNSSTFSVSASRQIILSRVRDVLLSGI